MSLLEDIFSFPDNDLSASMAAKVVQALLESEKPRITENGVDNLW